MTNNPRSKTKSMSKRARRRMRRARKMAAIKAKFDAAVRDPFGPEKRNLGKLLDGIMDSRYT